MPEEMRDMEPVVQGEGSAPAGHDCGTPGCAGQCTTSGSSNADKALGEYEHASFAVLLALVPLLVFTLFGQVGLF